MIQRPAPDDLAPIFWTTLTSSLPTYHLPGYLRKTNPGFTPAVCGSVPGEYSGRPSQIPIKHAARFARLCRRCSAIAGIDIREQIPLWPAEVVIIDLEVPA